MYNIRIEIKGEVIAEFESDGTNTILEDAINENVDIPSSCEVGLCEMCSCKVEGIVESNMESLVEGYILTCKSVAKSDLILKY